MYSICSLSSNAYGDISTALILEPIRLEEAAVSPEATGTSVSRHFLSCECRHAPSRSNSLPTPCIYVRSSAGSPSSRICSSPGLGQLPPSAGQGSRVTGRRCGPRSRTTSGVVPAKAGTQVTEHCVSVVLRCEHLRASKDDGNRQPRILRGSPQARLTPQDGATSHVSDQRVPAYAGTTRRDRVTALWIASPRCGHARDLFRDGGLRRGVEQARGSDAVICRHGCRAG